MKPPRSGSFLLLNRSSTKVPLLLATELHWRCSSYGTKSARNGSSGTVCEQGHEKREKLSDDPCPYPCVFLASRRGRKSRCHASSRRERQANTRQATVLYHWCILLLHVLATISGCTRRIYATETPRYTWHKTQGCFTGDVKPGLFASTVKEFT